MLLKLEMPGEQLGNVAALLPTQSLILEDSRNIRHPQGCSSNEKEGRRSIVLGPLAQAGTEGG